MFSAPKCPSVAVLQITDACFFLCFVLRYSSKTPGASKASTWNWGSTIYILNTELYNVSWQLTCNTYVRDMQVASQEEMFRFLQVAGRERLNAQEACPASLNFL